MNGKDLMSYSDIFDNHGITPEILKNRDTTEIFSESKIFLDG